ncbi:hypothetical protein Tco_1418538 [Tanacetum coccineum]
MNQCQIDLDTIEAVYTDRRIRSAPIKAYRPTEQPQFLEANSYGASHIDNSIPRKEKDPGSFTLPCYINNLCFDNSLADLGASIGQ